jgi:23S rRNA (cytosine1962-C5)-methyltransferase
MKSKVLSSLPNPSEKRIAIRISAEAERALRGGHPWLYTDAIQRQSHEGRSGDLAVIFDRKGRFLAIGLYDPKSPLRVRILHHGRPIPIDRDWFAMRIAQAGALRQTLRGSATSGYRLVHGENDGLPGLVIDRYGNSYVLKLYTTAWIVHLQSVLRVLIAETGGERFILRLSRQVQKEVDALHGLNDGMILHGHPLDGPLMFLENGFTFEVDPVHGQKTGFFLDQRENRERVEQLAGNKSVLNVFAYTGGFSLYAARGGAREVVS